MGSRPLGPVHIKGREIRFHLLARKVDECVSSPECTSVINISRHTKYCFPLKFSLYF
jgi:hypothetical protein